jgi:uncharacterized protein
MTTLQASLLAGSLALSASAAQPRLAVAPEQPASLFPHTAVRLLPGPFSEAAAANRAYLLAHSPDRLLAPFLREAGLPAKARPYGNWESMGLDGHTAGHYLSALALMIASGEDPDGEMRRRLDYMIDELERVQQAEGDGYIGSIAGGKAFWKRVGEGEVQLVRQRWVPWYTLHKMFAGLRDAYVVGGNEKARGLLIRYGDWCDRLTGGLTDAQMQQMNDVEYGGMNEILADIYAITGDEKYLNAAKRFNHRSVFEPLQNREDRLTGMHANTQVPKIVGMERIAALSQDQSLHIGAAFFWESVTRNRTVAFGGNSVSEHFNPPNDFSRMLRHREGPESCNTYNMLRLTEELFAAQPRADYAEYYESALYNHILSSINPARPGFVYFTPIRPAHYRVYSQPELGFWCCVGTGMENHGRYGRFIYSRAADGLFVNLFIASDLTVPELGLLLRQETQFPYEESTRFTLKLERPATFTLHLRHPAWTTPDGFAVSVNGQRFAAASESGSFAALRREWKDGDTVELALPMRLIIERLPDGSDWVAIKRGPILLAAPAGDHDLVGLYADDSRMGHVAYGPVVPLDQVPVALASAEDLPRHVKLDPAAGPLAHRLVDVLEPAVPGGLPLIPFFALHDQRYQIYWELATREGLAARRERLAAVEQARAAREAATIDSIAVGEQQPEVEHDLRGEGMETGTHNGRRWRHGRSIQYTLDPRGHAEVELAVTYSGDDRGREFQVSVNGQVLATQRLVGERPHGFVEKRYPLPSDLFNPAERITVRFQASSGLAGGLFDVRLLKPGAPAELSAD